MLVRTLFGVVEGGILVSMSASLCEGTAELSFPPVTLIRQNVTA